MLARFVVVGAGGFVGAVARYAVSLAVARVWTGEFPLGTFIVNVTGCFALGLFSTLATERIAVDVLWRLSFATGFVGAYTTFSTFEYETQRLTQAAAVWWAVANVVASVVVGFLAVRLGVAMARA